MVRFWCRACAGEHDNARDCPHYTDMRGSKEAHNRKYGVKAMRCTYCGDTKHNRTACPKDPKSIMSKKRKKERDRLTHKESQAHDREIRKANAQAKKDRAKKDGKAKDGCVVVALLVVGSLSGMIYVVVQVVQSL